MSRLARSILFTSLGALYLQGCAHNPKPAEPQAASSKVSHHSADELRHDFSDASHWSKVFDDKSRKEWQKPQHVVDLMQIKKGMSVADIGAGTGYFLPYLNSAVSSDAKVYAVEIEKNLVDHMKKRIQRESLNQCVAILGSPKGPKLAKSSIAKILLVNTWHHIESRKDYLKSLIDAMNENGEIYIVDFQPGKKGPGPADKHRIPLVQVYRELQSVGLHASIISEKLPYQYMIRGRVKPIE